MHDFTEEWAMKWIHMIAVGLLAFWMSIPASAETSTSVVSVTPARPQQCAETLANCQNFDAIVFVHGIYGSDDTFKNTSTGFDWPAKLPNCIELGPYCRHIDVFRLSYRTALFSWAKGNNPSFEEVAKGILDAMKPLRQRQYRSIGFIAHSLGGNVVSTYIHMLKTKLGHPQRSENAFVITLATPVLGAQIADLGTVLKHELGINDPLLRSLEQNNLYLTMLNEFREEEVVKEGRYSCRPVHLHAAYEKKYIGPLLVVSPNSAATSISKIVNSPVIGFQLNHIEIVKPPDESSPVYQWALNLIKTEYVRLETWDVAHKNAPAANRLCELQSFIPEQ
jgi:hypothetical protein